MLAEICRHPWLYAVEPFQIAGNIYYVGNRDVSAHLVDTDAGLVLLDTTYPQTVYLLLESIRTLGYDPQAIRYVINLHGHYDHMGGTRAVKELAGARTCIGERDMEIISEKPELSWAPEYGAQFHERFEVDRPLRKGDLIELGSTSIRCEHSPGHTAGTMSFFFNVEIDGKEYTAGIHGGPGTNTLTSRYMNEHSLPAERRKQFLATLGRLKETRVDIHLGAHPSQNDTFGKQSRKAVRTGNPFLDARAWQTFLDDVEADARALFASDPL